ncbi:hypothetical protein L1987_57945 [Smallanthus sonchifolius]|uniref:Uncharacterized protein n=1 Tax=Smallanthus sonchifolius TaxID=185202 RepID=A0ACB9DDV4_9ASTR|nr:hypothetical protein L1987_57945 [Smallanthus sonchifolius]
MNEEGGDMKPEKGVSSTSPIPVPETTTDTTNKKNDEEASDNIVPFYKLFMFADSIDFVLMVIGTITAIGSGIAMPLQTLIFGELIDTFGGNQDNKDIVHQVSKVSIKYVYLALGTGAAAFFHVGCWMVSGERQAARIRSLYLKTLLRQEVGYFDQEGKSGDVVECMSGDTVIIQDAMGEKVGKFIQLTSTIFGGFVIAFSQGWLLSLVLLSSLPPLMMSAAFMTILVAKLTSRGQAAYSVAAAVVEQTISSIRTVASFTREKQAIAKYEKSLAKAYRAGVQEGLVSGLGSGIFMFSLFCCYSLTIWFGGKLIVEKGYTGGQVINVMLAVMLGSISLGQASPCLSAIASGRVAAFKLFRDGATLDEIKSAAELASATKFIDKFPQGLDTMVGDQGSHMSGGQKQRIAIARAILKNPRILLLDEATSALDAESERVVQEALGRFKLNRTTIIVAHRLTTIKNSDAIAVIHHGKIVEKGSHSELLQNPEGAYCQLIRLQELNERQQGGDQDMEITEGISILNQESTPSYIISRQISGAEPKQEDSQTASNASLVRLAALNKPEIPEILLGSIAAVINGAILPIYGYLLSTIIKTFFEPAHELRKDSEFWALMLFVLGLASLIATPFRTYFFGVAGCKLIRRIRLKCFEKVVQMEIGWFDMTQNSSGIIGAKLSTDAASVRGLVGDNLSLLVQNSATAFSGLIIAFMGYWQLAFIVVLLIPLIGLNGYLQLRFFKGFSAGTKKLYEDASEIASDAVGSIRTVASFCAEDKVMKLYERKCEGPRKAGIKQGLVSGAAFGSSLFLLFLVYATSFYVGARFVAAGKTSFPNVFQVFLGLSLAAISVSQSGSFVPDAGKAKSAAASVFGILDQKSKIDYTGTTLENMRGDIQFSHVNFRYPSRPELEIFRDLSLDIPSGQTVALVGESGSGKSTIVSLLQRFYDVDSGQIMVDGVDIRKLRVKWLRQQIGVVSQEPVLFNDTIRANITYGYGKEGDATEAQVLEASELANAHGFISALHQGYDTSVGEKGIQLSGGQKQRVAIARAIVKAPKILLLDEATSALDAESEKVVQDALDRVMLHRTTVVVAHRLSTIHGADVIAVVKDGVIAEKGKHETLVNIKDGIYASLFALHTTTCSS